jgi:hypothetical protein
MTHPKTEEELERLAKDYANKYRNHVLMGEWNRLNECFKAGYRAAEKHIFETNRDRFGKCIARTFNEEGAGDQWWIPQSEVEKLESKLKIAVAALELSLEAMEMGAFHHNICPWLNGKECLCAHKKIPIASSLARQALLEISAKKD